MKTQTLILKITYDEKNNAKPSSWCWANVLSNLLVGENIVELLNYGAEEDEENISR